MTVTDDDGDLETGQRMTPVPANAGHPLDEAPLPEPCPPWCELTTPHGDSELYADRLHSSVSHCVTADGEDSPADISAALWMHYRESRPHICLNIGIADETSLELPEAAELARLLTSPPEEWAPVTLSMMDPDAAAHPGQVITRPFTRPSVLAVRQVLDTVTIFTQVRRPNDDQVPRYLAFTPAEAAELSAALTGLLESAR